MGFQGHFGGRTKNPQGSHLFVILPLGPKGGLSVLSWLAQAPSPDARARPLEVLSLQAAHVARDPHRRLCNAPGISPAGLTGQPLWQTTGRPPANHRPATGQPPADHRPASGHGLSGRLQGRPATTRHSGAKAGKGLHGPSRLGGALMGCQGPPGPQSALWARPAIRALTICALTSAGMIGAGSPTAEVNPRCPEASGPARVSRLLEEAL